MHLARPDAELPAGSPSGALRKQRREHLRAGSIRVTRRTVPQLGAPPSRLEDPMPKNKDFKRLIRDRQSRTGESYSTARAHLLSRTTTAPHAPVVCAVTGAAGRVAYNLLFRLAAGEVF